jgi:hypothetical protein
MSRSSAIAATTEALAALLRSRMPGYDDVLAAGFSVTTRPPDTARKSLAANTKSQLNVFLYQTQANAAWRNLDPPNQVRPGESGMPPLALTLHYMLTAYGDDNGFDDEAMSHRVLGAAMSVLHDNPLIRSDSIPSEFADTGLAFQFDRLRITPIVLPMDEMSKLWTALQTNYRVSAGYEVSVVLIDSEIAPRSALPVLKRGKLDRGPDVIASALPALASVRYPRSQQAAQLGDDIAIVGTSLGLSDTTVRLTTARLDAPIVLAPTLGDRPGELKIHVPTLAEDANVMSKWAPGLYTLAVVVQPQDKPARVSNEIPFALAPSITITPTSAAPGTVKLTAMSTPRVARGQRVLLIVGDQQAAQDELPNQGTPPPANLPAADPPPPADATKPSEMHFTVDGLAKNTDGTARFYTVRLRVDGIDSIPVKFDPNAPPAFDQQQQVKIQ